MTSDVGLPHQRDLSLVNQAEPVVGGGEGGFICAMCQRSFTTQRGLSLHQRRGHPEEYARVSEQMAATTRKYHWQLEDLETLARMELDLGAAERPTKVHVNIELAKQLNEAEHTWPIDKVSIAIKRPTEKAHGPPPTCCAAA